MVEGLESICVGTRPQLWHCSDGSRGRAGRMVGIHKAAAVALAGAVQPLHAGQCLAALPQLPPMAAVVPCSHMQQQPRRKDNIAALHQQHGHHRRPRHHRRRRCQCRQRTESVISWLQAKSSYVRCKLVERRLPMSTCVGCVEVASSLLVCRRETCMMAFILYC